MLISFLSCTNKQPVALNDLSVADLSGADLDMSSWPLWCGSFGVKVDDRMVYQLIAHITRLNTDACSGEAKAAIAALDPWKNRFCEYRRDVSEI